MESLQGHKNLSEWLLPQDSFYIENSILHNYS